MQDIPIGVVGAIRAGIEKGRFVEVVDDRSVSGGFLILTYERQNRTGETFDSWVADSSDVELYFEDVEWIVQWPTDDVGDLTGS